MHACIPRPAPAVAAMRAARPTARLPQSSNFRRLVLGCIDSYDSEQRRILQHFSKSTRFAFFCTFGIPSVKTTMKNHPENPDEQASSKQSPGEQYRAGKQTSDKDY